LREQDEAPFQNYCGGPGVTSTYRTGHGMKAWANKKLLTLYVVERWMGRLAASPHAEQFVLKGGMLLALRRPDRTGQFPSTRIMQ
jgi:hypothetical protein